MLAHVLVKKDRSRTITIVDKVFVANNIVGSTHLSETAPIVGPVVPDN